MAKATSNNKNKVPEKVGPLKETNLKPSNIKGAFTNETVYKNDPFTGTEVKIVTNDITVRSPIRQEIQINDFMSALRAAEMRVLPNRTRLFDIYSQALLDGHLYGIIEKRILGVLNQKLFYCDQDGEEVEKMGTFCRSNELRLIKRGIMEKLFWGVTGFEFIPGDQLRFSPIPRKHIHTKTQIISIEQNDQTFGFDYTQLANVWIIVDDPEDVGLLKQCAINVIYKRGALADWANFIEIFGMPVRVFKYDPNDPTSEAKLTKLVEEDGNLIAMLVPNTADVEVIDGKTANASGDLQGKFVKFCNDENSIVVLGNTETTGNSGTGSQAKSKTHSDQQKELTKADIEYLENKLNDPHFIKILESYGLPVVEGGRFNIKSEVDIAYAIQKIEIDTALSAAGLEISTDYFYDTYVIPVPKPGAKMLKAPAPAAMKGQDGINLSDDTIGDIRMSLMQKMIDKSLKDFFA